MYVVLTESNFFDSVFFVCTEKILTFACTKP